jgi:hypothetical protein
MRAGVVEYAKPDPGQQEDAGPVKEGGQNYVCAL